MATHSKWNGLLRAIWHYRYRYKCRELKANTEAKHEQQNKIHVKNVFSSLIYFYRAFTKYDFMGDQILTDFVFKLNLNFSKGNKSEFFSCIIEWIQQIRILLDSKISVLVCLG